jgi:hypothetical protein
MKNIAIITTVNNIALFKKTVVNFPKGIDLFAIDGSKGLFGLESFKLMYRKLRGRKIKWLVLADEDVVFVDPSGVFDLIKKMEFEETDVCGIRDGGVLSWRGKNPYLLNPFFCIINLEKIYSIYSESEFIKHQYVEKDEFNDDLSNLPFAYDKMSLFEEYYCFFLWLRRKNMKFAFLNAIGDSFENDLETTTVFGLNNEILLYHTWYARTYGSDEYHTKRIDKIIAKGVTETEFEHQNIIWLGSRRLLFRKKLYGFKKKLLNFLNK